MRYTVLLVAFWCLAFIVAGQAPPRLNVVDGVVYVTGLTHASTISTPADEKWLELFSVFTEEAFSKGLKQPVAGTYAWIADGFSFRPAYPFSGGATYHAVFSPDAFATFSSVGKGDATGKDLNSDRILLPEASHYFTFQISKATAASTSIKVVYPETDVLPENLLRMYICFSGPMMPGEAYKHLSLVNEKGEGVDRPFLVVDQELWDVSRMRLTILFDPGRIKRGLKANLDLGPPLKEGGQYVLMIDSTWRDAQGNALQRGFVKPFRVIAPLRARLTNESLTVIPPPAGSTAPLVVRFDRPMDHMLMMKYTTIKDAGNNRIDGKLELESDNTLRFTPDVPWKEGNCSILLSPLTEDVAGNNFKNAFDLDLATDHRVLADYSVIIPFSIVPSAH